MFYKSLYTELGKLFYCVAAADGKIDDAEKKALQQIVQKTWKPLEGSTDEFGTDQAYLIDFAFEFEEAEVTAHNYLEEFREFYSENKTRFTPEIQSKILNTCKSIAGSKGGSSRSEKKVIHDIHNIFEN